MKTFASVLSCVGLICAALPATAAPQREAITSVQVPAGDLDDAVEVLARQTGVSVMYPGDLLDGRRTAGVDGTLSPTEAFARLLQGTSLTVIEEHGALRIAKASSSGRIATRTEPLEPEVGNPCAGCDATAEVKQAELPMTARWEQRRLYYGRSYGQRRRDIEQVLEKLGARDVQGMHSQATCLVLVPAPSDGQGAPDSRNVTARWERVTFRAERGLNRRHPDGVNPVVFDELKQDILRLFVTRNLDVKGRDSFSVEVLYPAAR